MTANVFGNRFVGRDEPAWHQLGKVFTTPISASQALIEADLDYEVIKAPVVAELPSQGGLFNLPMQVDVPDRFAIVRTPTKDDNAYRTFGLVSGVYSLIQNREIAKYLDTLCESWPVETAGALGFGETTFFTLDAGLTSIKGEEIRQFFMATDVKDGSTALRMAFTPIRIVCQNTLNSGTSAATVLSWLPHTADASAQLAYRIALLQKLQSIRGTTLDNFQKMAETILSANVIADVFSQAYPMPVRPRKAALLDELTQHETEEYGSLYEEMTSAQAQWVAACERCNTLRNDAQVRLELMNDENGKLADTAWYVYNAVTDNEDHRDGPDTMFASALWGDRANAKVRAYQAALIATR